MNKTVRNIIIRIAMLLGASAFIFLVVVAKINRDETKVKQISVDVDEWNGISFVTKSQVLNLVENKFDVKNKILSGKQLEQIEKAVSVIPQVKKADAFTDDQGNLDIKIKQRNPLVRVYNMQGQSFYIADDGMKFPVTDNFAAKVPVVTGLITEACDTIRQIQSPELKQVYHIAGMVNKNELWKMMIGQYNINEKGQAELIPRFGNCTILFGDDKSAEQKLKRLDIFYFDVLKKIGWNYYKVINIMYKDQVVCLK